MVDWTGAGRARMATAVALLTLVLTEAHKMEPVVRARAVALGRRASPST